MRTREVTQEAIAEFFNRIHLKMQDAELLAAIRPMVKKQDYKPAVVSAWRNGRAAPLAEVIFAAALVTQTSLDELLFGESLSSQIAELRADLAGQEGTLAEIERRLSALGAPSVDPPRLAE